MRSGVPRSLLPATGDLFPRGDQPLVLRSCDVRVCTAFCGPLHDMVRQPHFILNPQRSVLRRRAMDSGDVQPPVFFRAIM